MKKLLSLLPLLAILLFAPPSISAENWIFIGRNNFKTLYIDVDSIEIRGTTGRAVWGKELYPDGSYMLLKKVFIKRIYKEAPLEARWYDAYGNLLKSVIVPANMLEYIFTPSPNNAWTQKIYSILWSPLLPQISKHIKVYA